MHREGGWTECFNQLENLIWSKHFIYSPASRPPLKSESQDGLDPGAPLRGSTAPVARPTWGGVRRAPGLGPRPPGSLGPPAGAPFSQCLVVVAGGDDGLVPTAVRQPVGTWLMP